MKLCTLRFTAFRLATSSGARNTSSIKSTTFTASFSFRPRVVMAGEPMRLNFGLNDQPIQRPTFFQLDQVIGTYFRGFHQQSFNLGREDIDAIDNQHVVAAAGETRQPPMTASARTVAADQVGEIAGATATIEPARIAIVLGVLASTAALAAWLPARRALAIAPAESLRAE